MWRSMEVASERVESTGKIAVALLDLGTATVSEIARATGLNRADACRWLYDMVRHGTAESVPGPGAPRYRLML